METFASVADELRHHPLFSGLADDDITALSAKAVQRTADPRGILFDEGAKCEGLWLVVSGWVRLYHSSADGRQRTLAFRGCGSALEVGPALDGRRHCASAVAHDGATLVLLERAAFQRVSREPSVVRAVIDHLCSEVREFDTAITVSMSKEARARTYCTLLRLTQQFGRGYGANVRIPHRLTRRDIGRASGVTIETAIRILSELRKQGIVQTTSQVVEIVDVNRLMRAAGCSDCQLCCSHAGLGDQGRDGAPPTGYSVSELVPRRIPMALPELARRPRLPALAAR
jgi:CRP-like cAMP-binding protein